MKGNWGNKSEPWANILQGIYTVQWEVVFRTFAKGHSFENTQQFATPQTVKYLESSWKTLTYWMCSLHSNEDEPG